MTGTFPRDTVKFTGGDAAPRVFLRAAPVIRCTAGIIGTIMIPPIPEDAGLREQSPEGVPLLTAELVFLPDPPPPPSPPRRFPGPGFFESLAWIAGFVMTLLAAQLAVGTVLLVNHIAGHKQIGELLRNADELQKVMLQVFNEHMGTIFGAAEAASVLFAVVAILFRLRPGGLSRLGLRLPSAGHSLLVLLLMLPLCFVCTQLQSWVTELIPDSDMGMQEFLTGMRDLSFPVLVLTLAVCPALGEELIFRGLIGRGLVTRWGVVAGVLTTSFLFGLVHMRPGQALAVIPLGIAMHFVYLTTGSFWGPVLLHFLNNAWAAFMLKYGESIGAGALAEEETLLPLELLAASAAAVCAVLMLLWQTRVSSMRTTTGVWYPGEPRGEESSLPEPQFAAQRPRPLLVACGTFCVIGFFAVFLRVTFAAD